MASKSWQLLSERPSTEDLLDRNTLAQALAESLYERTGPPLVAAITGVAGSGKSTLLELLQQWLGDDPRLLVVRAMPLPFAGGVAGQLFFSLIEAFRSRATDDSIKSLERAIQGIASLLLPEPDSSFAKSFPRFSKFPNLATNVERLFQKLSKLLRIRRVVVLLDGADSLPEAEKIELGWSVRHLIASNQMDLLIATSDASWLGAPGLTLELPPVEGSAARAALEAWGVPPAYLRGVEALLQASPRTPRALKQFCNRLHQALASTQSHPSVQPQILAALLWLEFAWPELFADIARYGAALLDAIVRQDPELLSGSPMLQAYCGDEARRQIVDACLSLPSPEREQTLAYVLSRAPGLAGSMADRMFEDLLSRDRFRLERALRWARRQSSGDFIRRLEHTILVDPDPIARRQAIGLMGQIGEGAVAPLLRILEAGKETADMLAAIQALGVARASEAVESLITASEAEALTEACFESLGFIGGDRAVSHLIRILNSGKPTQRAWAARALGHTKSERAIAYLVEQILQGSREERTAAVAGLKKINRDTGVQLLLRSVQTGSLEEKANGLEALSALGGDAARTQILHMLRGAQDEELELVETALRAAGTSEFLLNLASEVVADPKDKDGRMLLTLARIAGDRIVRPLVKQLHNPDLTLRERTARALLQIKSEHVVAELTEEIQFGSLPYEDQAIQIVGQIGGQRASEFLLECLSQGRAPGATIEALALLKEPAGLSALARLSIQNAGELPSEARRALKMVPGSIMLEQYISLARGSDLDTRRQIGEAMAEVLGSRAVYRLIEEIRYGDRALRSLAMDLLAAIGDEDVIVALISLLENGEPRDKELAAEALIQVNAPASVVHLIDLLEHALVETRVQAALTLGHIGGAAAVDPLLDLAQRGAPQDRKAAAQALGILREPKAIPKLLDLIRMESKDLWFVAAEALGLIGEPALQALLAMLRGKKRNDQKSAAAVVGHLKLGGAAPALLELLSNEDWSLRTIAAQALGQLGEPRHIPALGGLLSSENPNDRRFAGEAIASIGGQEAIDLFSTAFHGGDARTREEVLGWLAPMEPALSMGLVLEGLQASDPQVRREAVLASARQTDPRILDALAALHRAGDVEEQGVVEGVLGRMNHPAAGELLAELGGQVPPEPARPAVPTRGAGFSRYQEPSAAAPPETMEAEPQASPEEEAPPEEGQEYDEPDASEEMAEFEESQYPEDETGNEEQG